MKKCFLLYTFFSVFGFTSRGDIIPGKIIDTVKCIHNQGELYSLYLPSNYSQELEFPVVFILDPMGRGNHVVSEFTQIAEIFGYILVCPLNSKNGPFQPILNAVNAVLTDTQHRFSAKKNKKIITGFSGGARAAMQIAKNNAEFVGVIGCGAGIPQGMVLGDNLDFFYIGIVGKMDMNYMEMNLLDEEYRNNGSSGIFIYYKGDHSWPPKHILLEAFHWLDLSFIHIDGGHQRKSHAPLFLLEQNKKLDSLIDTKNYVFAYNHLSKLLATNSDSQNVLKYYMLKKNIEQNTAFRQKMEIQKKVFRIEKQKQQLYLEELLRIGFGMSQSGVQVQSIDWWKKQFDEIQSYPNLSESEEWIWLSERLIDYVWRNASIQYAEWMETKNIHAVLLFLQICSVFQPEECWPDYLLAKTYAGIKQNQKAFVHLEKAIEKGFENTKRLDRDGEWEGLRKKKKYIKLLGTINR